jgi:flagellar FliJ protein
LERLLELRRYREREWEVKLAAATGSCVLLNQQIRDRKQAIMRTIRSRKQPVGFLDVQGLYACELYMERLDQEIGALGAELAQKEHERSEIQRGFLEASKERKVMQRLKERRQAEYYRELKKEEFDALNDISTGISARHRGAGG